MTLSGSLMVFLSLLPAGHELPLVTVPEPRASLRPETVEQRKARHAKVERVRAGTVLLLHRGAHEYAPENTLSAIRAGFDLGADGVELDFRRTKDGVLVLFHDDRIERMLDGVGLIEESYYEELLLHSFTSLPMLVAKTERIPVLRDVLQMVRDHAGLLHLDIKVPGIDRELLDELRKADMLDHVVTYNHYNSAAFREAGTATLPFKGSLMEAGQDTSPTEAKRLLARPGKLVICDDPRAVLTELGRPCVAVSSRPPAILGVRLPGPLEQLEEVMRGRSHRVSVRIAAVRLAIFAPRCFTILAREVHRRADAEVRRAVAWNLGMIAKHRPSLVSNEVRGVLLQLLRDRDTAVRAEAAVACGRAGVKPAAAAIAAMLSDRSEHLDQWPDDEKRLRERRALIEVRGRYAFALGLLGVKSPAVVKVLRKTVKHRAVDRDWDFVGLDGAMAVWALGRLRAAEATGSLRTALFRDDPVLTKVDRVKAGAGNRVFRPGWWDFRIRRFVPGALADIGSAEAVSALRSVLDWRGAKAEGDLFSSYTRADAAEALARMRIEGREAILAELLTHEVPEARGAAIRFCLSQSEPRYAALLKSRARWALPWWNAQHRGGTSTRPTRRPAQPSRNERSEAGPSRPR
ncbi:MAG TPA: glycerophosphodiester phosphodiesterase family protein, partial [Thermoguttaceae bacterium]|nr:glycerophosphodiester phosphodiesterase family protein [Thermoguttaceae bacterium]